MITQFVHNLVAHPKVYDLSQMLLGARRVQRRVTAQCRAQRAIFAASGPGPDRAIVLDLGGGTGLLRRCWPATDMYICLDNDSEKLHGFRSKYPADIVLLANATRLPFRDGSIDIVLCSNVTHHLTDEGLAQLIAESARVLKSAGRLILADAVWAPRRRIGKFLWKYDRGSFPRSAETLQRSVRTCFTLTHWEQFAIYHEYILCTATKH